jgi:hypothetical protein
MASPACTTVKYSNRIGGAWKTPVLVDSGINATNIYIVIDTTNAAGHRYNLSQIAYRDYGNNYLKAALGNANDATAFTTVRPGTQSTSTGSRGAIVIDQNGRTNIFSWYNSSGKYSQCAYIDGQLSDTTWGTAGNWTVESNIAGVSTAYKALSATINGLNRHYFVFYSTPAIYYTKSINYAAWAAQTLFESPASWASISVRWQYANNPSDLTYGIDYLFIAGYGTNNLYWNNLSLGALLVHPGMNGGLNRPQLRGGLNG